MEAQKHLPQTILTEILARLPLRSISRFKSVCKTWKSILESPYFRRLFVSLHKTSSWSLTYESEELIAFHGCKTWDLPKSPASYIPTFLKSFDDNLGYSDALFLINPESDNRICFVGNPVLQQWLKIPPPPVDSIEYELGLVTRVDQDDVVLSFKVFCVVPVKDDAMSMFLYSSETGIWTSKVFSCTHDIIDGGYITINGIIYFLSQPRLLIAHDLYSDSDQFWSISYPDHSDENNPNFKRTLTRSGGFFMYVRTLALKEQTRFKVWRLKNDFLDGSWQLLWDISIPIMGCYVPVVMNPFDSGIVYLWSQQRRYVVSCDLRTRKHDAYPDDHQDYFIHQSLCEKRMDEIWGSGSSDEDFEVSVWLFQFVMPRWVESLPRPPQVEMIDTTSLLSYITSMQQNKKEEYRSNDLLLFWCGDDLLLF